MTHINAFISYSWDNDAHKAWVLKFATDLRHNGVDAMLDQWDARLGDDLAFFMEQGLSEAHLVLCVCSDSYIEKANSGRGGVGYEKRILAADMISETDRRYIIPIIRNNHGTRKLPTFLSGLYYEDFDDDNYIAHYASVLKRIYGEDVKDKPALGQNPFESTSVSDVITAKLNLQKNSYYNIQKEGKIRFDYKKNNGRFVIGAGQYEFMTSWSDCSSNSVYCYKDNVFRLGYRGGCTDFPTLESIPDLFDFSSRVHAVSEGEVVVLENLSHHFVAIRVLSVHRSSTDIEHLLEFEYKIYMPSPISDEDGNKELPSTEDSESYHKL